METLRHLFFKVLLADYLRKKLVFSQLAALPPIVLGKKLPDGLVLGARGPYGILVKDRDSELNQWFVNTYKNFYGTFPSGPAYQYGQAFLQPKLLMIKPACDATDEQLADAVRGITFESFSTTS